MSGWTAANQGTRSAWLQSYRAHRTASKLWTFMQRRADFDGLPSFVQAVPGWERFDDKRLWGDKLAAFPLRDALSHQCRMHDLSRRARLPT